MLHNCGRLTQTAVFLYGKRRHAAATVVGDHEVLSSLLNDEMTGSAPACAYSIERRQEAGRAIDGKGADRAFALIRGVKEATVGMREEPGRIHGLSSQTKRRQFTAGRLIAVGVDPFALLLSVRTDVH